MVKKHTGNAENQPGTDSLLFGLLQLMVSYIWPEASEKLNNNNKVFTRIKP